MILFTALIGRQIDRQWTKRNYIETQVIKIFQIDIYMDGCMDELMAGWIDKQIIRQINVWMYEQIDKHENYFD